MTNKVRLSLMKLTTNNKNQTEMPKMMSRNNKVVLRD